MEPPPPLPVAPLDYYLDTSPAAGAHTLVRRLGVVCLALGAAWALANLYATMSGAGFLSGRLRGGFAPMTFLLTVLLAAGGGLSLRAVPPVAARRLTEVYAIGTLANVAFFRGWDLFSGGGIGSPYAFFSSLSLLAYSSAFPVTLLVLLRLPVVRSIYQ